MSELILAQNQLNCGPNVAFQPKTYPVLQTTNFDMCGFISPARLDVSKLPCSNDLTSLLNLDAHMRSSVFMTVVTVPRTQLLTPSFRSMAIIVCMVCVFQAQSVSLIWRNCFITEGNVLKERFSRALDFHLRHSPCYHLHG